MKQEIDETYVHQLMGNNLKRLRSLRNISQLKLAISAGLTHNFINDIENCKKGISAKTLAKLSTVLNVDPHQFYLPQEMQNNEMLIYVKDLNDSLQMVVEDLTNQYIFKNKKEKK